VGSPASSIDWDRLQSEAEQAGRRCVAGAVIADTAGRVLVMRRAPTCDFLPGCWDIVGGHVEAGEGLLDALAREVEEETGWTGAVPRSLLAVDEWRGSGGGLRREFDFLVAVDGDLDRPRLAPAEHVEHRWIGSDDLDLLDENAGADGGLVRRSVELGLAAATGGLTHPHATIVLAPDDAAPLDALRQAWDPAMAATIGAHVTVTYPGEANEMALLRQRLSDLTAEVAPFALRLGGLSPFGQPEDGCYVEVDDPDAAYAQLRAAILRPPFARMTEQRAHVTIVHPRTSGLGPIAWEHLEGLSFDTELTVREIAITAFDGTTWRTVDRFALRG
jgi:8-oxo-dGTP pyrophosphatase MutT (NUDIX family)